MRQGYTELRGSSPSHMMPKNTSDTRVDGVAWGGRVGPPQASEGMARAAEASAQRRAFPVEILKKENDS